MPSIGQTPVKLHVYVTCARGAGEVDIGNKPSQVGIGVWITGCKEIVSIEELWARAVGEGKDFSQRSGSCEKKQTRKR
jgi:hypothetical protein